MFSSPFKLFCFGCFFPLRLDSFILPLLKSGVFRPRFKRRFPRNLKDSPPHLNGICSVPVAVPLQRQERSRVAPGNGPHPNPTPPARARPAQGDAENPLFFSPFASFASRRFGARGEEVQELGPGVGGENKRPRWESRLFSVPALQSGGADVSSRGTASPGTGPRLHPSFGAKIPPRCPEPAAAFGGSFGWIFFSSMNQISAQRLRPGPRCICSRDGAQPDPPFFLPIPPNSAAPQGAIASLFVPQLHSLSFPSQTAGEQFSRGKVFARVMRVGWVKAPGINAPRGEV